MIKDLGFIKNFSHLRICHANKNQISSIPPIPKQLEELTLSRNQILAINDFLSLTDQPDSLALQLLDLSFNQIERIQNIENLHSLLTLGICNKVDYVDCNKVQRLENLPRGLLRLAASANEITKIDNIDHLVDLEFLTLSKNKLTKIENLQHCTKLHTLLLSIFCFTQAKTILGKLKDWIAS